MRKKNISGKKAALTLGFKEFNRGYSTLASRFARTIVPPPCDCCYYFNWYEITLKMKQSYPTLYQFVMKKDTEEYFKKKNEHVKPNVNFNVII